jgi:hypothetical protein
MKRKISRVQNAIRLLILAASLLSSCTLPIRYYSADSLNTQSLFGKTAVVVPLDSITVEYVDRTNVVIDTLFPNEYFVKTANIMFSHSMADIFNIRTLQPEETDSLVLLKKSGFSKLGNDTINFAGASRIIAALAKKQGVDFVIIPYSCSLKNVAVQPTGWRDDKYRGPGYERPVSHSATAVFHIQVWDKKGSLLYERIGQGSRKRPPMYSLFKNEKKPGADPVKYAQQIYAPPLVRALYESIKSATAISSRSN